MGYEEQREWQRGEEAHQREVNDIEYEKRNAEEEVEAERRSARRKANAAREEYNNLESDFNRVCMEKEQLERSISKLQEEKKDLERNEKLLYKFIFEEYCFFEDWYEFAQEHNIELNEDNSIKDQKEGG
jgi:chromosome segregation ATPase